MPRKAHRRPLAVYGWPASPPIARNDAPHPHNTDAGKTPGRIAYEQDCLDRPRLFGAGVSRPDWNDLPQAARDAWEADPHPRDRRPL